MIKKFKRGKVYARFKDNIWAADLAEMRSFSSFNRNVEYVLFLTDVFAKYAWVNPWKDKNTKIVLHGFIEIVNESKRKPNKLWLDQRKEFYNNIIQKWLDDNDILMYSTHNEAKSVVAERFKKVLKGKIYKKWQPVTLNPILVI